MVGVSTPLMVECQQEISCTEACAEPKLRRREDGIPLEEVGDAAVDDGLHTFGDDGEEGYRPVVLGD